MKVVPSKVRAARAQAMLSQDEVAEALGTTKMTVYRWEHGDEPRGIRSKQARRLHEVLGVQPGSLMAQEASVPLTPAMPEALELNLADMFLELERDNRLRALEAARPEELDRYLRAIDRQVLAAGTQLQSPEHQEPGEQEGLAKYMRSLLELREEAEPYIGGPTAQEMAATLAAGAA